MNQNDLKHRVKALEEEVAGLRQAEQDLRQDEHTYGEVIENSQTGIYIHQDERIRFANSRFADIYGYPKEEIIGIETRRLVHPEDRALTDEMRKKRLRGEEVPSQYEARGLTKDGETIWIRRRNAKITYRGKPAILGNIVDITRQKEAEEELKDFAQALSHDLKNPLVSIHGLASRLLKDYKEKLGEKGREYIEHIQASAQQIEALISDLRTLAQLGQVIIEYEDVDTSEVVQEVASSLQAQLKDRGIELSIAEDFPVVRCDRGRIFQVLENLVGNAIKYMGNPENPQIEVGYEDKGQAHLFSVKDNGIGIAPENHKKIFESFKRLKEVKGEEGTGLGLAIAKRIVRNHGGKIWVESEKKKGSTFYFTLPK
ncbi:MAG: ATP-binding protein [Deltaproteobacteria bacterium]|jgi:PAS domain S-box-containing protein